MPFDPVHLSMGVRELLKGAGKSLITAPQSNEGMPLLGCTRNAVGGTCVRDDSGEGTAANFTGS